MASAVTVTAGRTTVAVSVIVGGVPTEAQLPALAGSVIVMGLGARLSVLTVVSVTITGLGVKLMVLVTTLTTVVATGGTVGAGAGQVLSVKLALDRLGCSRLQVVRKSNELTSTAIWFL